MKNRILVSMVFLFVMFLTSTIIWKVGEFAMLKEHTEWNEQIHGIQYFFKVITFQNGTNRILFCVQGLAILLLIYLWISFWKEKKS